jgi:hypothetical protein
MEAGAAIDAFAVWLFVLVVFLGIASPAVLVQWWRDRREEATRRQIALTDALHWQLGPIVSPVVRKSLWGSWQIEIAVPFSRPAAVGQIVRVAHALLPAADGLNRDDYELVLTPQQEALPPADGPPDHTRMAA